jgi:hypothetical protein
MSSSFFVFPEDLFAKLYVPGWNLGDVRITDGVQNLCDSNSMGELSIGDLLEAHFRGDYGLVNEDATDIARTRQAKIEGRSFTGIWQFGNDVMKIITIPSHRSTTVCLLLED